MLKDYIVITNKAETVSRISLEKLGFSTKRNDAKTIGQFGSGIKYAPIAALRNNLEWFFTGNDSNGPFTLEYIVQEEDGVDCIAYKYGDYIKSSSFTLEAGVMSWEDPFQILREPIANAMDGASLTEDGWYNISVITVDTNKPETMEKLKPRDNEFSVYITASPELMKVINNYDLYFSVNRKPIYSNYYGKILDKVDSVSRFYCLNVLVKSDDSSVSVFDYQFDNLELNEERTIKSLWDLDYAVAKMICSVKDEDTIEEYIKEFSTASNENCSIWELNRLSNHSFKHYGTEGAESWINVWNKIFTDKSIMLSQEQGTSDGVRLGVINRGYKPIVINNKTAQALFTSMGVKSVFDILGQQIDYDIEDDISDYPRLIEAIKIASYFEKGLIPLSDDIGTFESKKEGVMGMCVTIENNEKRIIIEKYHAKSGTIQEIVGTLIHEYDHYNTNIGDSSDMIGREFRNIADTRIGNLMVDTFQEPLAEKKYGGIYIHLSKTARLNSMKYESEYVSTISKVILSIGGLSFIIKCGINSIANSGSCLVSDDGDYIYVPVNGPFEIESEIK